MYKSKLKEWDISKSFKAQEVLAVFHAMEDSQAEGRPSQFMMRGQEVDIKWVRHYIKRNRSRMKLHLANRQVSPTAGSPTASISTTTSGDEVSYQGATSQPALGLPAPGASQPAEGLIRSMHVYIEGAFASKQWFFDTDGVFRSRKGDKGRRYLLPLWDLLNRTSQLMGRAEKVDLVGMLDPAFAYLDDIVRDECPRTVPFMLAVFEVLHARGRQDLTEMFLKYVKNLSSRILGPAHPQTRVWEQALAVYPGDHDEIFPRFFFWLVQTVRQSSGHQAPCRMGIKRHSCSRVRVCRALETQEYRLGFHIRMLEQDCARSSRHDRLFSGRRAAAGGGGGRVDIPRRTPTTHPNHGPIDPPPLRRYRPGDAQGRRNPATLSVCGDAAAATLAFAPSAGRPPAPPLRRDVQAAEYRSPINVAPAGYLREAHAAT